MLLTLKNFSDIDYSNQSVLSNVLRSMELERPKTLSPVPQWNLPLVLDVLSRHPFEPINSCSLKFLTYKTVFLIALASGRRRSEIHALSADNACVNFTHDESAVELHTFPGFWRRINSRLWHTRLFISHLFLVRLRALTACCVRLGLSNLILGECHTFAMVVVDCSFPSVIR